jgi:hypothetical protein
VFSIVNKELRPENLTKKELKTINSILKKKKKGKGVNVK